MEIVGQEIDTNPAAVGEAKGDTIELGAWQFHRSIDTGSRDTLTEPTTGIVTEATVARVAGRIDADPIAVPEAHRTT